MEKELLHSRWYFNMKYSTTGAQRKGAQPWLFHGRLSRKKEMPKVYIKMWEDKRDRTYKT